ncbi:hypothetical protein [Akkermansia sp.]|uniref:hypothetical protein n=1 Tax=Akkermansia sp. TaxID=1872421 RepID=UPI0025C6786B|nr:hypothetical protein [Akkermansia sp.]
MKVYNKIVWDINTLEILEEDSYEYTGSITLCKGGKGGGGSTVQYMYTETPSKQSPKSVSAGASAAAATQREKASRNRGVAASILTQRRQNTSGSAGLTAQNSGSSTLG